MIRSDDYHYSGTHRLALTALVALAHVADLLKKVSMSSVPSVQIFLEFRE